MRENDSKDKQPAEGQDTQGDGYQIDKTSQRILAVGATLGIVLLSLSAVVWSLGDVNLSLKLKRNT